MKRNRAHIRLAEIFSSVFLIGPPMSDKLVEMVENLFTPEEAMVVSKMPFYYPGSLKRIARRARITEEKAKDILDGVSERNIILSSGNRYSLLPIIPGIFEYSLMNGDTSGWRKRYAKQIVELFSTGYIKKYLKVNVPGIRTIPVEKTVDKCGEHVVDSDLVSKMLDYHTDFAVANVCQCRQSMHMAGKDCSRASVNDGCLVFGSFALGMEKNGLGRRVSREEMREVVRERWEKKLVFLTVDVSVESPNAICTCCECCCHALETINHFGGMKFMANPHYIAVVDESECNHCGRCVRICNTGAHTISGKVHFYDAEKCIGCGICLERCKPGAIRLVENSAFRPPAKDFKALGKRLLPRVAAGGALAKLSDLKERILGA